MVERLGWTLVHSVWEGAVVALLLAVLLHWTRRSPANLRYGLACGALALLAALPAVTFGLLASVQVDATESVSSAGVTVVTDSIVVRGGEGPLSIVVVLWAFGTAVMSLRLLGTLLQIERWKRRHTQPAGAVWQGRLDVLARRLGLRRPVALLVSDRLGVPAAWGVLRAVVVLPTSLLTGLSAEEAETVLLHELAHIRRHDYLVNLLQTVVETVLFYHPAVWWVSSLVRREREHCCDDAVVAITSDPMPYARALLHLEERRQTLPSLALSAKGSPLMNRIARILGNPPASARFSPVTSTLAAVAVLGAVLGGAYEAQAQSTAPAKSSTPKSYPATRRDDSPASPATAVPATKKSPAQRAADALVAKRRAVIAAQARLASSQAQRLAQTQAQLAWTQAQLAALRAQIAVAQKRVLAQPATPAQEKAMATKMAESRAIASATTVSEAAIPKPHDAQRTIATTPTRPERSPEANADEIEHSVGMNSDSLHYWVDVKDGSFAAVMRRLAQMANLQVVISPGAYLNVTLYVNMRSPEDLVQILSRAAGATFRKEGDIYYFTSSFTGTSGGTGGGGFGR